MCGKCCHHYESDGKLKPCKYLVKTKNLSYCKTYLTRKSKTLRIENGQKVRCINRIDSYFDYEECPYNDKRPMHTFENVKKLRNGKFRI